MSLHRIWRNAAGLVGLTVLSAALSAALATPALPGSDLAQSAVKEALSAPKAVQETAPELAPKPKAAPTKATPASPNAASPNAASELRQQGVAKAQQGARRAPKTAVVRSTAYNSTAGQTDSSPFITATGTRTRFGVIALSRDLLARFPYGTRVRIEDLSGRYNGLLGGRVFIVEDTMHPRKRNTVDVWMSSRREALQWGVRNIRITAVN